MKELNVSQLGEREGIEKKFRNSEDRSLFTFTWNGIDSYKHVCLCAAHHIQRKEFVTNAISHCIWNTHVCSAIGRRAVSLWMKTQRVQKSRNESNIISMNHIAWRRNMIAESNRCKRAHSLPRPFHSEDASDQSSIFSFEIDNGKSYDFLCTFACAIDVFLVLAFVHHLFVVRK